MVDEDAGNGCFHWLLFYSVQETGVKETDFKPLRDSKAAEKTTFRNFQLKLIIEEFSFGETVKEQTTSLPICAQSDVSGRHQMGVFLLIRAGLPSQVTRH